MSPLPSLPLVPMPHVPTASLSAASLPAPLHHFFFSLSHYHMCQCLTASLFHCITVQLPHCLASSLSYCLTILQFCTVCSVNQYFDASSIIVYQLFDFHCSIRFVRLFSVRLFVYSVHFLSWYWNCIPGIFIPNIRQVTKHHTSDSTIFYLV
jgi:hypothetical protein